MNPMIISFLSIAALSFAAPAVARPYDVYGLWLSAAKDGHIEIRDCGDGTPCGNLVWVDPAKADTHLDVRNRDPSLRSRKLIGTPIIRGFEPAPIGWKGGEIYNPEDGKTFAASLEKLPNGSLKVKGCLGPLCRTNIWTPVKLGSSEGK